MRLLTAGCDMDLLAALSTDLGVARIVRGWL